MYRKTIITLIVLSLMVSCDKSENNIMNGSKKELKLKNPFLGSWVRYMPDGEWGNALEVYDFYQNGKYKIIVGIIPDKQDNTLPDALLITGKYNIEDNSIRLRIDEDDEQLFDFEMHDECLFLKNENDEIFILKQVITNRKTP